MVKGDTPEDAFFRLKTFAVVGVSEDLTKFGRIVYDRLKRAGMKVYPVNPKLDTVAGDKCYRSLSALPVKPEGVSVVVPPKATIEVAKEAVKVGVKAVWMQPGAEHPDAVKILKDAGIPVIYGGSCILVALAKQGK
jgi:hypothetical protein